MHEIDWGKLNEILTPAAVKEEQRRKAEELVRTGQLTRVKTLFDEWRRAIEQLAKYMKAHGYHPHIDRTETRVTLSTDEDEELVLQVDLQELEIVLTLAGARDVVVLNNTKPEAFSLSTALDSTIDKNKYFEALLVRFAKGLPRL